MEIKEPRISKTEMPKTHIFNIAWLNIVDGLIALFTLCNYTGNLAYRYSLEAMPLEPVSAFSCLYNTFFNIKYK